MSLNATPRGDRIHIALFGKRNAGKSSVINAMTNQELAIVSNVKGTTTDPVYKAMELLPLGPVVMIDTPGLDDEGELGEKRVKKAKEVLAKADIALVIMDATAGMTEFEEDMICLIEEKKIPYLKVYNKMDLANAQEWKEDKACFVSAKDKKGIWELKEEIDRIFVDGEEGERFQIAVVSFGFKHGIPADVDLVFDVRFLPNPYYIDTLREKTGNEAEVQDYVMQNDKGRIFLDKLKDMMEFLIPNYILEGKNQLVIAIGCTGGKHRSVTLANALYQLLDQEESYGVRIEHRDIGKDSITKRK